MNNSITVYNSCIKIVAHKLWFWPIFLGKTGFFSNFCTGAYPKVAPSGSCGISLESSPKIMKYVSKRFSFSLWKSGKKWLWNFLEFSPTLTPRETLKIPYNQKNAFYNAPPLYSYLQNKKSFSPIGLSFKVDLV